MQRPEPSLDQLKEGIRATWTAGDFGHIAQHTSKADEEFVDRLVIAAGTQVLDVACGTGNLAIPAARRGAHATSVDIAPIFSSRRGNAPIPKTWTPPSTKARRNNCPTPTLSSIW